MPRPDELIRELQVRLEAERQRTRQLDEMLTRQYTRAAAEYSRGFHAGYVQGRRCAALHLDPAPTGRPRLTPEEWERDTRALLDRTTAAKENV